MEGNPDLQDYEDLLNDDLPAYDDNLDNGTAGGEKAGADKK